MDESSDAVENMPPQRSALYIALRTAAILLAFTLVFTALMAAFIRHGVEDTANPYK